MKKLKDLIRPNIWNLKPYTCARNDYVGEARVWLDANENSRIQGYNRYPDPLQENVKRRLGKYRGVEANRIFLGVGSDECIDMAYRVFCRPRIDNVVAIEPTYGMYKVCADINDVEYRRVGLGENFTLDVEALLAACDEFTKIIWICSPNNPTANAFDCSQICEVASRFDGIIMVDEAYVDFSDKGSMLSMLDAFPGLVVMQTFSKAWASAAIRLGIAYASPEIIDVFNKVKYPYNINLLTQHRALNVLENMNEVEQAVKEIVMARLQLAKQLDELDVVKQVYPSDANFLLVEVADADKVYKYLCSCGVIVRNRNSVHLCGNCVRITVGTVEENSILINELKKYVS